MYHSTSLFFLLTLISSFNLDYNLLKTGPQFLNFCAEWQHSTSFQFIAISMQKGFTVKNGFTFKSVHTNAILFKLVSKQCFWLKDLGSQYVFQTASGAIFSLRTSLQVAFILHSVGRSNINTLSLLLSHWATLITQAKAKSSVVVRITNNLSIIFWSN